MRSLLLVILAILSSMGSIQATHLMGGTMHYKYLGQNGANFDYEVVITAYRDCYRGQVPFDDEITICVYSQSTNRLEKSERVKFDGKVKVEPVGYVNCPIVVDNICIEKGTYTKVISLPQSNFGYVLKWERCCRNEQVNLLSNTAEGTAVDGQTYLCYIPRTAYRNSSPVFSEVPVPYMCLYDTTPIKNFGVDPDGDSLVFSFIHPYAGASLGQAVKDECDENLNLVKASYNPGFSKDNPFGVNGFAEIDPNNGLTTVMSQKEGNFSLAVLIEEYRNGFLLSKSILDMQINVFQCTPNERPEFVNGAKTLNLNAGERFCYTFSGRDINVGDQVTIEGIGDIFTGGNGFAPPLATMRKVTGTTTVSSEFCWTPSCDQARDKPYVFTVDLYDDGCPLKFNTINVYAYVRKFQSEVEVQGPTTVCPNERYIYQASQFKTNSTFEWKVEGGFVVQYPQFPDQSEVEIEWTQNPARIILTEINENGCRGDSVVYDVTVSPPVPLPIISGLDTVCFDAVESYVAQDAPNIASYYWEVDGGTITSATNQKTVSVRWDEPGGGKLKLVQYSTDGCASDTAEFNVAVRLVPNPVILGPSSVCPNNSALYNVMNPNNESEYFWYLDGVLVGTTNGEDIQLDFGNPRTSLIKVFERTKDGCEGDTGYSAVNVDHNLDGQVPMFLDSLCQFTTGVRYFVGNTLGSRYTWEVVLGDKVWDTDTNFILVDWNVVGNGSVSVSEENYDAVNDEVCVSPKRTLPVWIFPKPTTSGIFGDTVFCQQNLTTVFNVSGMNGSSYTWFIDEDTSGISGQGTSSISVPIDAAGTFLIEVVEVSIMGCPGDTLKKNLIVHPIPTANAIDGDSVVCFPNLNGVIYSVNGLPGSTFQWWIEGGAIVRQDSSTVEVNWNDNQVGRLRVFETTEFGCFNDTLSLDIWIDHPEIRMHLLTVAPPPNSDDAMHVYWELINGGRYNQSFDIQKRRANSNNPFTSVGTANTGDRFYEESGINTDSNAFEYRVVGTDLCGNAIVSDTLTNIWLRGNKIAPHAVSMTFTNYIGWNDAFVSYEIHRMLPNRSAYSYYYSPTDQGPSVFDNGLEYYTQCYRVKGLENQGENRESWSNEICFNFDPVVYIPNAFTPDDDDLNDIYKAVGGSFKSMNLKIFNRWGEKLFESNDIEKGWDGTYKGGSAAQGVYMYVLEYTAFDDTVYSHKGTVTLLR